MINRSDLLKDLQRELPKIEKDILEYSEYKEGLAAHLQEEYEKAQAAGRTAEHFVAWREAQITQAAVAWLLTCVFVRFLEDNNLLVEPMLSGPASSNQNGKDTKPLQHAKERMVAFFNENPTLEERDYLLDLFAQLERFPVIAELLDHRHNPLWQIPVSSDGAKALIDFFQKIDADTGEIIYDFTDADWDTRFLGDLYQDLSESVRKRYALLQTPEFVEIFILDYTLEKAKDTFGLPGLRLIDPTCGSGHFLLTTFERMFDAWQKREPATNTRELAQRALDVVHGVDINPYAIAICRFRLFIAAMKAAGSHKVKDAPDFHFNLACGDSLLHGRRFEGTSGLQASLMEEDEPLKHVLDVEDKDSLNKILGQQYHVVVGNPPYIVVRDKALNQAYRERYSTCSRQYSLGVPFTERFFDLTLSSDEHGSVGYMGIITANSFMKREFGKSFVQSYLVKKDISHIVDTSGAYIPGHGTPTLIMFARNRKPIGDSIVSVLGVNGEPGIPSDPSNGVVWSSIVSGVEKSDYDSEYISVRAVDRSSYSKHPWSLSGGCSSDLKVELERDSYTLGELIDNPIGRAVRIGEEQCFFFNGARAEMYNLPKASIKGYLIGENVRDWNGIIKDHVWYPYISQNTEIAKMALWGWRCILKNRSTFQGNMADAGKEWYEYMQHTPSAYKEPLSISFASVASQNHFYLDYGGNVFKQSAPVIKFKNEVEKNRIVTYLGLLNSSLSSFWMKQVFMDKGNGGIGGGIGDEKWERRFDHDGTKLQKLPVLPKKIDGNTYKEIELLSEKLEEISKIETSLIENFKEYTENQELSDTVLNLMEIRGQKVFLQEEIDWLTYSLNGFAAEDVTILSLKGYSISGKKLNKGQRSFEIVLANKVRDGLVRTAWFERHLSVASITIPDSFDLEYRELVERRVELTQSDIFIGELEKPEYKRRWNQTPEKDLVEILSKQLMLSIIEGELSKGEMISVSILCDKLRKNSLLRKIVEFIAPNSEPEIQDFVVDLVEKFSLPVQYQNMLKASSMKKYRAWQETWDKQRQEDAIDAEFAVDLPLSDEDAANEEKVAVYEIDKAKAAAKKAEVVGHIPIPPKYAASDFRKPSYWPLRGKLDVPKERFFSLPGCEKDGDSTLVIGWAGMNHLQRATAIATWYLDRKETDGWEVEKLKPMLVALDELIPWLKQWHNEIDPEFGERMGDYYEGFLSEEMRMLDVTKDDLLAWEPPTAPTKKAAAKKKTTVKKAKSKKDTLTEVSDTNTSKEQG